jgi:hypothetical protein
MPKTEFVTDHEVIIRMPSVECQALRKKKKPGQTYTRLMMDIKNGKRQKISVPKVNGPIPWGVKKIYLTADEFQHLVEDAQRRGISVSKAMRADIFKQPEVPPVVPSKESEYTLRADKELRALIASMLEQERFGHLRERRESMAFAEIARILMTEAL